MSEKKCICCNGPGHAAGTVAIVYPVPSPAIRDGERVKALEALNFINGLLFENVFYKDNSTAEGNFRQAIQTIRAALSQHPVTVPDGWRDIESAPRDGREIIAWLSSEKGFQDTTALLFFNDGQWCWNSSGDTVRRPDLIKGWMEWPEPPASEVV